MSNQDCSPFLENDLRLSNQYYVNNLTYSHLRNMNQSRVLLELNFLIRSTYELACQALSKMISLLKFFRELKSHG